MPATTAPTPAICATSPMKTTFGLAICPSSIFRHPRNINDPVLPFVFAARVLSVGHFHQLLKHSLLHLDIVLRQKRLRDSDHLHSIVHGYHKLQRISRKRLYRPQLFLRKLQQRHPLFFAFFRSALRHIPVAACQISARFAARSVCSGGVRTPASGWSASVV